MGLQSVAEAGAAQVAKKCYKNQTLGWIGVVTLDHLGQQRGVSVEPLGNVYLSDDEALLTARAPAKPESNPFVEKEYEFVNNETGEHVMQMMRPLVLVEDPRELPAGGERGDRYVPGLEDEPLQHTIHGPTAAAHAQNTRAALEADSDREGPTAGEDDLPGDQVQAVPGFLAGHRLTGTAALPEIDDADPVQVGSPTGAPPQAPLTQTPGASAGVKAGDIEYGENSQPIPEETAGEIKQTGEETGAADQAQGKPDEGEYAQHEEVGSPDAPNATAETSDGSA